MANRFSLSRGFKKFLVASIWWFMFISAFLIYNGFEESHKPSDVAPIAIRSKLFKSEDSRRLRKGPKYLKDTMDARTGDPKVARNEKWIVVTSIFHPTEQVMKLSRISGWTLLVVADKKTPPNWALNNVVFLDTETQLKLGYAVVKLLPWNAYTRKIIGYLYAIENGAKFIYDTDDDNAPHDITTFEQNYVLTKHSRGLVTGNTSFVTNPYVHFGQRTVWPRGYPLDQISKPFNKTYTVCQMYTPLIQQGLVNGDPDVDAIFRLTRKWNSRLNIQFDGHAPPIIYPPSVLSPFNSQNTMFLYDAFWSMVLPISVTFRVTDIWRGYWAQPLLWLIGGRLGFYPPHTTQVRNAHVYLQDFGEEDKLYKQSGDLVRFLSNWKCSKDRLYPCMLELTEEIASLGMWLSKEINLMRAWISDLQKVGYIEPAFKSRSTCLTDKDETTAVFNAVIRTEPVLRSGGLQNFCNFSMIPTTVDDSEAQSKSKLEFPSTLLVITFNLPHYKNIWLLDLIYRPHYPNIVYCGQTSPMLNNLNLYSHFTAAGIKDFSFVRTINIKKGNLAYECALRVIDMKYSVRSYLFVSDDVVLNFWNTAGLNPDATWIPNFILYRNLKTDLELQDPNIERWSNWKLHNESTQRGITALRESKNPLIQKYFLNREQFGVNSSMIGIVQSDLFHLPVAKQEIFYEVGTVLWKAEVFLELATALLADGLSSSKNIVHLTGKSLYEKNTVLRPFEFFNASNIFLHPLKLSFVIANIDLHRNARNDTPTAKPRLVHMTQTRCLEAKLPDQVCADDGYGVDYCKHYISKVLEYDSNDV